MKIFAGKKKNIHITPGEKLNFFLKRKKIMKKLHLAKLKNQPVHEEGNKFLNQSFTHKNDCDEDDEEMMYFSDSEERKKLGAIYKEFPNKYNLILHYNDEALRINKKILMIIKHPKVNSITENNINDLNLMDTQIKKWKGIKEKSGKDVKACKESVRRASVFMKTLIQNLEVNIVCWILIIRFGNLRRWIIKCMIIFFCKVLKIITEQNLLSQ